MPRSSRLEDKYNNAFSGLSATNYQGAIDELANRPELTVLDEDNFASNSASLPPSQQSTKAYIDSKLYLEKEIITSRVITIEELQQERLINRFRIPANITLTPPSGFSFAPWLPTVRNYSPQATDADFVTDSVASNIYELFYVGTTIFINNLKPYTRTNVVIENNDAEDLAINYNTTSWTGLSLRQIGNIGVVGNKFPINFQVVTTGGSSDALSIIPQYTGLFRIGFLLHLRSASARVNLGVRIHNFTTGEVIAVTDFSYIRGTNGHNLYTMQAAFVPVPCITGEVFRVEFIREGTITGSTTLDPTYKSKLYVQSDIL